MNPVYFYLTQFIVSTGLWLITWILVLPDANLMQHVFIVLLAGVFLVKGQIYERYTHKCRKEQA